MVEVRPWYTNFLHVYFFYICKKHFLHNVNLSLKYNEFSKFDTEYSNQHLINSVQILITKNQFIYLCFSYNGFKIQLKPQILHDKLCKYKYKKKKKTKINCLYKKVNKNNFNKLITKCIQIENNDKDI